MTPDGCDVVQRRTIKHDSPPMVRDHRNLPIVVDVVKVGVTVALLIISGVILGLFHGYVSDTHRLMREGAMSKQR